MYSLIVRVLRALGFSLGTGGSGIDAASITSGTIDAARLPSYVDDVVEYANLAAFPATGTTGKIFVALDTGIQYRWTGSAYVDIAALKFNVAGDTLTGTGGAGFYGAIPQSSQPATPASGFRLFANSVGKLAWIGTNGFSLVFDGTANTADRTYPLPDSTGTLVTDTTFPTVDAAAIHAATSKATPVDADEFSIWNSVGGVLAKVTFANLYNYIKVKLSAAGYIYLASDTYANIVATYGSNTYNGCIFLVTDVGLTPTVWRNVNGDLQHDIKEIMVLQLSPRLCWGGAPGGTATYSQTGTTVTVTTVGAHGFTAARHNGMEIRLVQSSGLLTTGWFTDFTYISATSFSCTSTVSQSTSGNLGSGIATVTVNASASLPANLIKKGGYVICDGLVDLTNSGNSKAFSFYIGSVPLNGNMTLTATTNCRVSTAAYFMSALKQFIAYPGSGASFGTSTSTSGMAAGDTSAAWSVSATVQITNASDFAGFCGGYIAIRRGT